MHVTQKQREAAALYSAIMEEVKLRNACARSLLYGALKVQPIFIREFCFLQFRMICEAIALGCLVAHGDIKATQSRKFQTLWSAAEIIDKLTKLHAHFFPMPFTRQATGERSSHLAAGPDRALTKADLLTLYGKCGGVLHRGTKAKLLSPKLPTQTDFPDIDNWSRSIQALLKSHFVLMQGGQNVFICEMNDGEDAAVSTRIGVASGPSKYVPPGRG